jgi:polar amino acid transport system substrate-binding protein
MEYVNEKKELVGFDIDLVKEIALAGGFEVEIKNTAWDGIFAGLENEAYNAIISSVTITDERKAKMDFSDPYFKVDQAIVTPAAAKNVAKLADLKGKTVGAQIGTTGAMEVQKDKSLKLKNYDEVGLAFEDLINGRLAAVVCDTPTAAQYALQNEKYKGRLIVAGQIATDEFYGIAVKKGKADALKLINDGLKKAKESGKIDELKKKWVP